MEVPLPQRQGQYKLSHGLHFSVWITWQVHMRSRVQGLFIYTVHSVLWGEWQLHIITTIKHLSLPIHSTSSTKKIDLLACFGTYCVRHRYELSITPFKAIAASRTSRKRVVMVVPSSWGRAWHFGHSSTLSKDLHFHMLPVFSPNVIPVLKCIKNITNSQLYIHYIFII